MRSIIKNKKGQMDIISILIVSVIMIIAGGIVWYSFSLMNNDLKADPDIGGNNQSITALNNAEKSFGILNWGPIALFIAMFISLLISYYKIGSESYWFFIHFLVLIVVVVGSGEFSNYYYELTLDPDIGSTFTTKMVLPSLLMFNLPEIMTILGFISIIVLVTKWIYDKKNGTNLPGY